MLSHLLIYCRSGFESEAAQEISSRAAELGFYGYPKFTDRAGYLLFHLQAPQDALQLIQKLRFHSLIFVRQWVACVAPLNGLSGRDRISPMLEQVAELPQAAELRVETADTTEGRNLNGFARKLGSALAGALRSRDLLLPRKQHSDWRLHLFVVSGQDFLLGVAPANNSSKWEQGILRLKFPAAAPSRSTLKLEEAWHWFIPKRHWDDKIAGGKRAVDLGAAPGGWTWQLVQRGMFVTAVDNGPMNADLMESGQVEHLTEDAFTYQPARPVDLMVCDIVDKPARVIELMARWALNGWSRILIFNLKLPMKQRFIEVETRLDELQSLLREAGIDYRLEARHLYHDREEITCYLELK